MKINKCIKKHIIHILRILKYENKNKIANSRLPIVKLKLELRN